MYKDTRRGADAIQADLCSALPTPKTLGINEIQDIYYLPQKDILMSTQGNKITWEWRMRLLYKIRWMHHRILLRYFAIRTDPRIALLPAETRSQYYQEFKFNSISTGLSNSKARSRLLVRQTGFQHARLAWFLAWGRGGEGLFTSTVPYLRGDPSYALSFWKEGGIMISKQHIPRLSSSPSLAHQYPQW